MFSYFQPKHVRQGRQYIKDAEKILAYKRDLWPASSVVEFETGLVSLRQAVKERDRPKVEAAATQLDQLCSGLLPPPRDAALRENVEVFLVAIVIALGVRTYFLQPFTIPTGSMQPTLNGILAYPTAEPPPNILVRVAHFAWFGRSYVDVVAREDCTISNVREFKSLLPFVERTPLISNTGFFTRTEVITDRGSYVIKEPVDTVIRYFVKPAGSTYRAGEPIARGYVNTGDHVFVDKVSYHFRLPRRSEVFVFNTLGVPTQENRRKPNGPSQFYIKRLAGTPGDELRIAPPQLFINGKVAEEPGFQKVMSCQNGYQGYSNGPANQARFGILGDPEIPWTIPPKNYFALGDNSFHSSDSRDWGSVPQNNLMGYGLIVYWPFGAHWGRIH
jgi:signal peptidase I